MIRFPSSLFDGRCPVPNRSSTFLLDQRPSLQSDAQSSQAAPLTSGGEEYRVLKVHGRNQLQTGEPVTCLWYFLVNSGGNGRGGVVLTPYSRYASMEA